MTYDPLDLLLFYIANSVLLQVYFVLGLRFIRNYLKLRRETDSDEKIDIRPLFYGLYFFFQVIGQLFLAIFDFTTGFEMSSVGPESALIWNISISFNIFGWLFLAILAEKTVLKGRDKYVLVILYLIFYIIGIINPDRTHSTFFIMISFAFCSYIPMGYAYIASKSEGEVKKKAIFVANGTMVIFLAWIMYTDNVLEILMPVLGLRQVYVGILSNLIKVDGNVLLYLGYKEITPKKEDKREKIKLALIETVLFLTFAALLALVIGAVLSRYIVEIRPEPIYSIGRIQQLKNISFILHATFVSLCMVCAALFYRKSKKKGEKGYNKFLQLLSLFFVILGVSYIFRIILVFFIPPDLQIFYYEFIERTPLTQNWAFVQILIMQIGFGIYILSIEYIVFKKKTRYLLSISVILSNLIVFFLPWDLFLSFKYISHIWTFAVVGIMVLVHMFLLVSKEGIITKYSTCIIIGLILFLIVFLLNPLTSFSIFSNINYLEAHTVLVPSFLIAANILFLIGYRTKEIYSGERAPLEETKPELIERTFRFKKPEEMTEEEISFYREQKICLVCKNKVRRFNVFICDCDALYCAKCAQALTEVENICWACEAPIDESKPIKEYKEELVTKAGTIPSEIIKKKKKEYKK